ncbi:MAG: NAD-dependent epimerase/dehydratase family protein [Eubacteriaceae bacterium]
MRFIKAIVVGAYGLFVESLVARLKKEACETFVITGNKIKDGKKHNGVIEDYSFEYDNDNIHYILESAKSDVVIYTGALDPNFTWKNQSDAVTYIAGLNNMLISAVKAGVKRFVYLSQTDVYDEAQSGLINEDSPANPTVLKTMTIKNGEDIALRYARENGMEVVILRCSEVYGFFNDRIDEQSDITRLCLEISKEEISDVYSNKKHDCIHVFDVVEAVFRTISNKEIPHNIYNICSGKAVTEYQVLKMMNILLRKNNKVKIIKDSTQSIAEFSNELAIKELGFSIKYSFRDGFKQYVEELKENELLDTTKKEGYHFGRIGKNLQSIFGWFFPYLETIFVFLVVHVLVIWTGTSTYMQAIDLYLLFVVFIAIIYGKGQTITALLLCLAGKIGIIGKGIFITNIVVDYNTYVWMLQLLIIGMGIGYIRDRYKQSNDDKEENIKYLEAELAEIKEINDSNIRLKKIFENRLINYKDSFGRIYSIVTKLDDLEPDKIMFAAVDVVTQIMGSENVVIYNVDKGSSYARLTASSVDLAYEVPKSIKLESLQEVYEEILKNKVYINRSMDSNKPSMAGGVYHEDVLESIVIIWPLPFENTTLYHMNLFTVLLNLIAQAMHRANQYIDESRLSRYLEGTSILTQKSFQKIYEIKKNGSDMNLADYYILEINNKEKSLKQLNDIIVPMLRQHDYLGIGKNDNLCLLLTNTNENEAEFVIKRLQQKGIGIRKGVNNLDGK